MDKDQQGQGLTRRKKILFLVLFILISSGFALAGGEAALRLKGKKPWHMYKVDIKVDPGGRFHQRHETLGYSEIPGEFTVTYGTGYSYKLTHLPDTLRITKPLDRYAHPSDKEEFWIFGCSFTHGWSLSDDETYAWLLQERFPEYEVVNFGVDGYSTMHSLLQIREALKSRRAPKVVIIAYASFHDERNTFSRKRRKEVAPYTILKPQTQPAARLDRDGNLVYKMSKVEYRWFPLMRYSALSAFLERRYNDFEVAYLHRSHEVTKAIIREIADLVRENKGVLVIAGIMPDDKTRDMLEFARSEGIEAVDISVDLNKKENSNMPHDAHPSALANRKYADKLEAFLKAKVL